jgi:hypothetical protein
LTLVQQIIEQVTLIRELGLATAAPFSLLSREQMAEEMRKIRGRLSHCHPCSL